MKISGKLLGVAGVVLLLSGCVEPVPYGGSYGAVYGEYPSTYYGGAYAYPEYVYPYSYGHHAWGPYDRDHYWDRRHYWDRHRYNSDGHFRGPEHREEHEHHR